MSFIPATPNRTVFAVLAVMAVAVLGLFMRRGAEPPTTGAPPAGLPPAEPEPSHALVVGDEDDEPDEDVAITSDGWAFVPDGDEVQIVPPPEPDDPLIASLGETSPVHVDRNTGALEEAPRGALPHAKPGEHLDAGDLIGARVVRGAVGIDPWRLEALGREHEYRAWAFETEAAARLACDLLRSRIVRVPNDEDGTPHAPDEADYTLALAMTERGVADVATDSGD
ncbi:MAG: hypothetical protein HY076_04140 [Candidatus Eisenbacteria bacterium]|uniref:Uncharacterized protein n=1 Tax=Eiseniibacteriota bacterium TaxID=2212470 RepID=A0A9D6L5T9_UNCEI|nr:hypothetical protein [Candidatus Eisenbacteria bacterium]